MTNYQNEIMELLKGETPKQKYEYLRGALFVANGVSFLDCKSDGELLAAILVNAIRGLNEEQTKHLIHSLLERLPKNSPLKVYRFLWCSCVHESAYATISLHRTREGAEKAMAWHRKEREDEWNEIFKDDYPDMKIEDMEGWAIDEMEILD